MLTKKRTPLYEKYVPDIFNSLDEMIIGVDTSYAIKFVNKTSEKLLNLKTQELIGKKIDQIFDKIPGPSDSQITVLDENRNVIPFNISVKNIYENTRPGQVNDKSDRLIGYIFILKDIIDITGGLKQLEANTKEIGQKNNKIAQLKQEIDKNKASSEEIISQRLREIEEEHARLLASISNLNLGFIMTDKYQNILMYNESAYYILPSLYSNSKTINELCKFENINYSLNQDLEKSMLENKSIYIPEIQANSKYIDLHLSPIKMDKTSNGDCLGAVIIIKNKTDQHRLEESKEDIFSIASHELRTPLTAIYGYTSLIKEIYFKDLQNEELKKIINKIGFLSNKLSINVNNFLDSQKLEDGKIELKKDQCDLYSIINEAIKETERYSLEKNLYTKFDPPTTPVTVIGDQKRLIHIITILLDNAIKFTQNGGIHIKIQIQDDFAKIIIQDTGLGIPEENRVLLFNKFQQAEENLLTRQEGTGLGLHIAKLLIEKMGGKIQLERTELNKGSTFSFTIPIFKNE